ncbi:MAG: NADH-quinone oxidoreductase subunit J [Actinobacteria bacterium]|jgi:NADH-quinone oxidoreductase subunit J|nr:NADH-quinone oxidoreductase subunit J [Actinomycetota bacterium]
MPGGDFHPVLFFIVAAWILVAGVGVVALRSIVHSAVSMVFCFLGVAFAFALLHAELLAIIQVLIYVGAISVVIIFAIMLTQQQTGGLHLFFNRRSIWALPLAVGVALLLSAVLIASDVLPEGSEAHNPGVGALSALLFNKYVLPFELVSLVLLAAMVGAIVLARREGKD